MGAGSKSKKPRLGRRSAGLDHKKAWRLGEGFALSSSVKGRRHGMLKQGSNVI